MQSFNMQKKLFKLLFPFISASLLMLSAGCALRPAETDDLARIKGVGIDNGSNSSISGIRHASLRDTSLSIGARAGLASRAREINKEILTHTAHLNRIFNFYAMMLDNNVMPPVLIEGRNTLEQTDDDTIRIADRAYVINSQAYFITAPPTWQDYLLFHCTTPEIPDRSLLPRNGVEKKVWDRYIEEGWMAGRTQGNAIFLENLGRLKRDYNGMILYRTLLAQHMVSPPFVAKQNLGITGNAHEMAINDRVLRITVKPAFQLDGEKWEAELTPKRTKTELPTIGCELENCVKK